MIRRTVNISLIVIFSAAVGSCKDIKKNPKWYRPDLGPDIHVVGRAAMWQAKDIDIKGTKFKAGAGPAVYKDEENNEPDYYRIEVSYSLHDGNTLVCFSREFHIKEIPENLLNKPIGDIISYSKKRRTVTFTIGSNKYSYVLPNTGTSVQNN